MPLGDLAHDGETEPRARHPPRLLRAVEAVEDVRAVDLGDAGTLVVDGQRAVEEPHGHGAVLGAPLRGVVQEVGDRALETGTLADDVPGRHLDVEGESRCAAADPGDHPVDELGHVDRLDDVGQRLVAGQLHEVADEGGELLDLGVHVVEQLGPRLRRQSDTVGAVDLAEQVEVGAQRGERRAQLVAGVGDELTLAVPRGGERREHLVERRGQAGQLVAALHRQRAQVLGAGDVLGGVGEPSYRAQAVAGHGPAGEAGPDHAGEAEEQHHGAELGEQCLLGVERLRDHHRGSVVAVHRRHPPAGAVAADGAHRCRLPVLRDGVLGSAEQLLHLVGVLGADQPGTGPVEAGHPDVRGPEVLRRHLDPAVAHDGGLGGLGAVQQRVVERRLQLHAHGDVGTERHQRHRRPGGERGEDGDPGGQRPAVVPAVDGLRWWEDGHDSFST